MERFGPGENGQSGPPSEVVLFDQSPSGPTKNVPFHFQTFSFPVPLELVTAVKMADGSDVSNF